MRVFIFILLAVLVGSCCTTKEYDCDYSDYKTISLEDFEWVKEVGYVEALRIIEGSLILISKENNLINKSEEFNVYRIDASNGNFVDSTTIKERIIDYYKRYTYEDLPYGIKYFIKDTLNSCIEQLNILFDYSKKLDVENENEIVSIEIIRKYSNAQFVSKVLKFKFNEEKIYGIGDFAFYNGCYLILSLGIIRDKINTPVHMIGFLDLQKLIDNY